jgi:Zn-dependent peptidase ImmA (M78 family)
MLWKMDNKSLESLKNTYNCHELEGLDGVYPVPVGAICSMLGIKANFSKMQNNESGKICKEDEQYSIFVNEKDHPLRQRFTVAHELGHYCLHKDTLDTNGEILERNDYSSEGIDEKEIQANAFAAELLMPQIYFLEKYSELKLIKDLASYFLVSELAINTRLINLGKMTA